MMRDQRGEIFFPAVFFLIQKTMISLKYAALSPTEYR